MNWFGEVIFRSLIEQLEIKVTILGDLIKERRAFVDVWHIGVKFSFIVPILLSKFLVFGVILLKFEEIE